MVTDRGAAGKYPLTGQLSLTRRHRLDKLHLQGGREGWSGGRRGVYDRWTELASPLLKLLNRACPRVRDGVHRPGQNWKKLLSI